MAFGKSCNRNSSPRELGGGGVGFVSVSCFVLFLSLTCSAVAVASVTYALSLASAECSHDTMTAAAPGCWLPGLLRAMSVTAQLGVEDIHFLLPVE